MSDLSIILMIGFLLPLQLYGHILYAKNTEGGKTQPNICTWCGLGVLAVANFVSHYQITDSIIASGQALSSMILFVFTFSKIIKSRKTFNKKIQKPVLWEKIGVSLGILAGIAWYIWKDTPHAPAWANLLFMISYIFIMIPMVVGVYRDPSTEHYAPFACWAGAFLVGIWILYLQKESWAAYSYPSLMLLLTLLLLVFSLRKKQQPQIAKATMAHA